VNATKQPFNFSAAPHHGSARAGIVSFAASRFAATRSDSLWVVPIIARRIVPSTRRGCDGSDKIAVRTARRTPVVASVQFALNESLCGRHLFHHEAAGTTQPDRAHRRGRRAKRHHTHSSPITSRPTSSHHQRSAARRQDGRAAEPQSSKISTPRSGRVGENAVASWLHARATGAASIARQPKGCLAISCRRRKGVEA
jgi:hypothetical protein